MEKIFTGREIGKALSDVWERADEYLEAGVITAAEAKGRQCACAALANELGVNKEFEEPAR